MYIENFKNFINENDGTSEPKKPAIYKIGDKVRLKPYEECSLTVSWREKVRNSATGIILEVISVEAKSGKWLYSGKVIYGTYRNISRNFKISSRVVENPFNMKFIEKQVTTDGVEKFISLVKNAKFKINDNVSISTGAKLIPFSENEEETKSDMEITTKIINISVETTIRKNQLCYLINTYRSVPENFIEKESELSDIAIIHVIDAINKKLGLDKGEAIELGKNKLYEYKFKMESLGTNQIFSHDSKIFFKNRDDVNKFLDDIKNVVEKHVDKDFQIFSQQKMPTVNHIERDSPVYDYPRIERDKILQIARNLKIDIEKVLKDNDVNIKMSDMGF